MGQCLISTPETPQVFALFAPLATGVLTPGAAGEMDIGQLQAVFATLAPCVPVFGPPLAAAG